MAIRIPARDGTPLAADLAEPDGPPRGAVLIAGAMGVPRRFYAPFARHLAAHGLAALTLDYRGIAGSRPERLRGFDATLVDWGEQDLAGACDFLARRFEALPIGWVGHSVGAQLFGIVEGVRVDAALFVGAQDGHWRHWPGLSRPALFALWHAVIPAVVAVAGRLPMRRLTGGGEDVPAGVALEWARWGRHRHYAWSHAGPRGGRNFTRYAGPLRSYVLADDRWAPRPTHDALLRRYASARPETRVVRPRDVGRRRIGHFGFFRPALKATLWEEAASWLAGALEKAKPAGIDPAGSGDAMRGPG